MSHLLTGDYALVMVMYQTGSIYEQLLLGGQGASHYDSAKLFPGGDIQVIWVGWSSDDRVNGSRSDSSFNKTNILQSVGEDDNSGLETQ